MDDKVEMKSIKIPENVFIKRVIVNYMYSNFVKVLSGIEIELSDRKTERISCGRFNSTEIFNFNQN